MKKILVVGGGSIGERHVRCFQKTGRAIVSLCEINNEVRERVESTYSLPHAYSDFEEALQGDFDAAAICTPAHLHISMAQQLAAKGIHLLIEKPLSVSTEGLESFQETAASSGVSVGVAYVYRAHPALQAMKQAIEAGRIGKVLQVVMAGGQHFPFYRPAYASTYYREHRTGGGAIQDALTHMINAAEWLVGPVTRLVADAQHYVLPDVEVEDTVNVITRHHLPSGPVMGSFSLNQHQPANETILTVVGDQGVVRLEAHRARWLSCTQVDGDFQVEEEFALERDDLFTRQAGAFLDQVEGKSPAACSVEDAAQSLRAGLAALQSVTSGKWIDV